jgi:hypothetical protein
MVLIDFIFLPENVPAMIPLGLRIRSRKQEEEADSFERPPHTKGMAEKWMVAEADGMTGDSSSGLDSLR